MYSLGIILIFFFVRDQDEQVDREAGVENGTESKGKKKKKKKKHGKLKIWHSLKKCIQGLPPFLPKFQTKIISLRNVSGGGVLVKP